MVEGGALGITPTAQLAWDGEDVAEHQLTETAFRALADDEGADVPATVTLSLKTDAPEGEVLLAGDTVSLSARTDDGVVKLDDTAAAITLYEPDATGAATGRAVASANVAGGKLNITLLESAFDAEEEAVALGADAARRPRTKRLQTRLPRTKRLRMMLPSWTKRPWNRQLQRALTCRSRRRLRTVMPLPW